MKKMMLVAAAIAAMAGWGQPAQAGTSQRTMDTTAAAELVARVNDVRAGLGVPALTVDAELTAKAAGWAATMAEAGRIWHSVLTDGVTADWAKLGENVGMAHTVEAVHRAFVASPGHYENLAAPDFEAIGVGIAWVDGTLYATEVFMRRQPASRPVTPPAAAASTPAAPPAQAAPSVAPRPARRPVEARTPTTRPAAAPPARAARPAPAARPVVPAAAPAPAVSPPAPPAPSVDPQPVPAAPPSTPQHEIELAASRHPAGTAGGTRVVASGMATGACTAVIAALALVARPGRPSSRASRTPAGGTGRRGRCDRPGA